MGELVGSRNLLFKVLAGVFLSVSTVICLVAFPPLLLLLLGMVAKLLSSHCWDFLMNAVWKAPPGSWGPPGVLLGSPGGLSSGFLLALEFERGQGQTL